MRRTCLGAVLIPGLLTAAPAHADPGISVGVGRVAVVRSDKVISTLVVGDPEIADVVAEGENAVLVFGKKAGRTDLVLMDAGHRLVRKSTIVVGVTGGEDTIVVRRGDKDGVTADAWVCAPSCAKVNVK